MNVDKRISLKTSIYNITVCSTDDFDVVYNTLQDSITAVSKRFSLKTSTASEIELLHEQGALVNSNIDEVSVFRFRNMRQKMNGKRTHIFLTLTGACNCRCPYCFARDCYSEATMKKEDVPYVIAFISQQLRIRESTLLNVDFFGGEPLLCEELYLRLMTEIQTLCEKLNVKTAFQFYTNGTIKPSFGYETFKKFDVTFLVTLDGPKETHDALRPMNNGESGFSLISAHLLELKRSGGKATIRINFGKRSYRRIPALLDEIINMGLDQYPIEFYPIQNMSPQSAEYEDAVSASELKDLVEYLWNESELRGIRVATRIAPSNCYCSAFTNSMFVVDPNLNVYKCALLQYDRKYSIGNLKRNTDWNRDSVFYDWMNYDPTENEACRKCASLPICAGGCGGSGTFRHGTHRHSNCYELSPAMIKMRMKRYVERRYGDAVNSLDERETRVFRLEGRRLELP